MRTLRTLAVAAVALMLTLSGTSLANAEPLHPNAAGSFKTLKINGTQWKAVKKAQQIYSANNSYTLDYRIVQKYYHGTGHDTEWSHKFAAGWMQTGRSITHLPSKARSQINAYRVKVFGGVDPTVVAKRAPNCRGITGHRDYPSQGITSYYYNSCDTNNVIAGAGACLPIVAYIAGKVKGWPAAVIAGIMVFGCAVTGASVTAAKSNSSLGAIIVQVEDRGWNPTPPGHEYVIVRVLPQ
ncbi:hypothetical protein [Microlunatus soli]|uniref:N-acetylmuramoyl-L-alanine amidase n=1 Tax=Microlunatus soli TaxID=630515 RepID=A0A1H1QB99_9ACTN|nr:hypothetical protein [Microlunatus soli]SDS20705.1 hypothetical protein SAMN04489812_1208 [Microlunatus soli]